MLILSLKFVKLHHRLTMCRSKVPLPSANLVAALPSLFTGQCVSKRAHDVGVEIPQGSCRQADIRRGRPTLNPVGVNVYGKSESKVTENKAVISRNLEPWPLSDSSPRLGGETEKVLFMVEKNVKKITNRVSTIEKI